MNNQKDYGYICQMTRYNKNRRWYKHSMTYTILDGVLKMVKDNRLNAQIKNR